MSLKIITQKELNELIEWLKPYTPNERLEMILEAARTVNIPELEAAIEMYWQNDANQLIENELLNEFEKKCIRLGELQAAHQAIRFTVQLENGNTLQGEINYLTKEVEKLKSKLRSLAI